MRAFESLLEKEYMLLLEFDERVVDFDVQPVTIPVPGVPKGYTPDVLVQFHPKAETGEILPPYLTEVKHTDDLNRNAEKYALKFSLARQYADDRGWSFGVTTEKDIRTQRLINLKFLREYRNFDPEPCDCSFVLNHARHSFSMSVDDLIESIALDHEKRLYWLPIVWNLILRRQLVVNLDEPLNGQTIIAEVGDC